MERQNKIGTDGKLVQNKSHWQLINGNMECKMGSEY